MTVQRATDGAVITLRLLRVHPKSLRPKDIPPESDMRFFASATPRPTKNIRSLAERRRDLQRKGEGNSDEGSPS